MVLTKLFLDIFILIYGLEGCEMVSGYHDSPANSPNVDQIWLGVLGHFQMKTVC